MKIIAKKRNMRFGNIRVNRGEVTEVSEIFKGAIEKHFSDEVEFVTDEVVGEQGVTEEVTEEVKEEPKKKATRPKKK